MTAKNGLIAKIVDIEWQMFANVPNAGGKAVCQEDHGTFEINRSSQFASWSQAALESYLGDLTEAAHDGRNLMTEKYARMMKSTSPAEYALVEDLIPPLDAETIALVERIVDVVLGWEEELARRYPYIVSRGRPLRCSEDAPGVTSLETYLRGELATYSPGTLRLYWGNVLKQKAKDLNGAEMTLAHMVKRYGYGSLEEANERLKARG